MKFIIIKLIIIILIPVIVLIYFLLQDGIKPINTEYNQTLEYVYTNKITVNNIFTTVFNEAKNCSRKYSAACKEKNRRNLEKYFINSCQLDFCYSTYFIRLSNDNKLEKLFLSGDYKLEFINSIGEKIVSNFLQNNQKKLMGFRINEMFSTMHYLNDLYSEAEIIVPIIVDNKKLGAFVRLYGD